MSEIKRFEDLVVWQKSHELVLEVYKVTQQFPNDEKFGLTSQIRRSAVSVAANIAEGSKRQHLKEYQELFNLSEEIGRMLNGLTKSLSKRREV